MTQFDFGLMDPTVESGTQLATDLSKFRDAIETTHAGATRPPYAQPGLMWLRQRAATAQDVMLYDGSQDGLIGTWNPVAHSWTSADAAGVLATAAATSPGNGQCYFGLSGANCVLAPRDGNKLIIGGVTQTVPSAGVFISPAGLLTNNVYNIYAFMSGATMTLEAVFTGHATDTASGVQIKAGDASRTLVGKVLVVSGPAFVDSGNQRYVISWFHRQMKVSIGDPGLVTTASNVPIDYSSLGHAGFLTWAFEDILVAVSGFGVSVVGNNNHGVWCAIDGAAVSEQASGSSVANTTACDLACIVGALATEGFHYGTALIDMNTGTGNFRIQVTVTTRG